GGRDFAIAGNRRAVDWLLETHLTPVAANGTSVLAFPPSVEVHPNMFLKTMLEAGVPLDYGFTNGGIRRTLRDVADGARALFRPSQVLSDPNMLPWSVIAFSLTTSPLRSRWTNAWGEPVDLDLVVESALRLHENASLPLMRAMRADRPEREKAPVHGFTCGGTHMLYALLTAMRAGYTGQDRPARVRQQTELMVWRLRADMGLIDSFYHDRAAQPGVAWYELEAKVKLLSHGEECLALADRRDIVKLAPAQQTQRRAATASLRRMIDEIEAKNLGEVREMDRELFRQFVGDVCHARHGLTFA